MSEEPKKIVLGTRGSALALAQAEMAEAALRAAHPELVVERKIIKTTGDRRTDVPLMNVAAAEGHLDKGVFVKELEVALAAGEIDVAVHSLKDVPSDLAEGFIIGAVLPRAPVADVLISKKDGGLEGLAEGAAVATSSVRRQRQLTFLRPDLVLADIRGNVPTRIRKLAENPELDGILLAEAGLRRLGYGETIDQSGVQLRVSVLDPEVFLPAAGQGAVALETRAEDANLIKHLHRVHDFDTGLAIKLERDFLLRLGAGCDTPVGVLVTMNETTIRVRARVFEDGEDQPLEVDMTEPIDGNENFAKTLVRSLKRTQS